MRQKWTRSAKKMDLSNGNGAMPFATITHYLKLKLNEKSRFETSAKDNTNIDDAARHLVTSILAIEQEHLDRHDAESFENNNQQIRVDSRDKTRSDSGCC